MRTPIIHHPHFPSIFCPLILRSWLFQVELRVAIGTVYSEESKLANTASAQKEIRKNTRRRSRNRLVKSKTRTVVKRATVAIDDGEANALDEIRMAQIELDSAVSKGIIHKNTAARKKSRLVKRYRKTAANAK